MSLKEKITAAKGKLKAVEVPEWNLTLYIRQISVGERIRLFELIENNKLEAKLSVYLCLCGLAGEDGRRIFTDDDFDTLAAQSAVVIDRLGAEVTQHNRMVGAAVEESKKDSAATQN